MELIYFMVNNPKVKKDGETVNNLLTRDDTNLPTKNSIGNNFYTNFYA